MSELTREEALQIAAMYGLTTEINMQLAAVNHPNRR